MIYWGQKLGGDDPYMQRWCWITRRFSIRVHRWFRGDDDRHFHDHDWNFVCWVLKGSEQDISPEGIDLLTPGSLRFRKAEYAHIVKTDGCWTLVITGAKIRKFGFWVKNKSGKRIWLKAKRYFIRYGHP